MNNDMARICSSFFISSQHQKLHHTFCTSSYQQQQQ